MTQAQLAIPLSASSTLRLHLHLTVLATSIVLFVTSASGDLNSSTVALGSFVYALPDRFDPTRSLSTALYEFPSTIDFATRLAKVLARKTGRAVYVGNSAGFEDSVGGGTVEEEIDGFKRVVEAVMGQLNSDERI